MPSMYTANNTGYNTLPCLTPFKTEKPALVIDFHLMFDLCKTVTLAYTLKVIHYDFVIH